MARCAFWMERQRSSSVSLGNVHSLRVSGWRSSGKLATSRQARSQNVFSTSLLRGPDRLLRNAARSHQSVNRGTQIDSPVQVRSPFPVKNVGHSLQAPNLTGPFHEAGVFVRWREPQSRAQGMSNSSRNGYCERGKSRLSYEIPDD
jgi:hypothetical protein